MKVLLRRYFLFEGSPRHAILLPVRPSHSVGVTDLCKVIKVASIMCIATKASEIRYSGWGANRVFPRYPSKTIQND